jgi:hypothetical protein
MVQGKSATRDVARLVDGLFIIEISRLLTSELFKKSRGLRSGRLKAAEVEDERQVVSTAMKLLN